MSIYLTYQNNTSLSNSQNTITALQTNQTKLQGNITDLWANLALLQNYSNELMKNQTDLQQKIFDIQNPTPSVTIQSVEPILIGPPPSSQMTVSPTGVSFEFNGTLFLNLTVFVSTQHAGALAIPHTSVSLNPTYNESQIWIGFSTSGISATDYFAPINVETQILSISISCQSFYRFTNSHILNYPSFDIGYVGFH